MHEDHCMARVGPPSTLNLHAILSPLASFRPCLVTPITCRMVPDQVTEQFPPIFESRTTNSPLNKKNHRAVSTYIARCRRPEQQKTIEYLHCLLTCEMTAADAKEHFCAELCEVCGISCRQRATQIQAILCRWPANKGQEHCD